MLYKFNILFLLSYVNYKSWVLVVILRSSSTVQHTINNACTYILTLWIHFCSICNFSRYLFWQNHYHTFTQVSQSCEKCVFYTNFVNCVGIFVYYAGIMLNDFAFLLCSKLCWHNTFKPKHRRVNYIAIMYMNWIIPNYSLVSWTFLRDLIMCTTLSYYSGTSE